MRRWTLAAAALVGTLVLAGAQDKGSDADAEAKKGAKCDLSKVEKRDYCPGCKAFVGEKDIDKEKNACKKCKGAIEKVDTCLKACFPCKMHDGKEIRHGKRCCPESAKDCCVELVVNALVVERCGKCGQAARAAKDIKHQPEKCDGKVERTCTQSGRWPHGGKEPT